MVIPQGMAYGMLAGMPVEYGLYSSLFPPLIYMFFGTASHLSLGTNAPISILVADSVTAAIPTDTDCSDDVTSADCERILNATLVLCILSGIFYFVFWVFRFSMIVSFVPDPVLAGFTTGASVIIITSNMKHALGITTKRGQLWEIWGDIFSKLDEINWAAFAFFVLSYATIMGLKEVNKKYKDKLKVPIPEQLVVLVVSTLIVAISGVDVPKVKDIPEGLYSPKMPKFDDVGALVQPSLICTIITYILTVNVCKALGNNYGYEISADQEFVANGICALVGGITGSYLPSGSFSRSALVGEISGPDGTALHNLFSAIMIVIVLLFATPLLYHMPRAIMAAIIYAALKNMITFQTAKRLYKVSKVDFVLWLVAFVFTSLLGVTWGIIISITVSIMLLVKYQARPAARVLGVLKGTTDLCVDIKQFIEAHEIEGVKIFEFQAPLHFANKDHFESRLKKMEARCQWSKLYAVIIDCSSITGIDITCIKMLERLQARYTALNIELVFANWKGRDMRALLDASGLYDTIDPSRFYLDMASALLYTKKIVNDAKAKEINGDALGESVEMVPLTSNESVV